MVKKKLTSLVALLLVCIMVCTLTACTATLRGTYTSQGELIEQSFTFKEDNKVEVSAFGINIEGDYEIRDGEITITYSLFGLSYDWVKSFERKGASIFVDGIEFVREK